jgi:hypothetical protein
MMISTDEMAKAWVSVMGSAYNAGSSSCVHLFARHGDSITCCQCGVTVTGETLASLGYVMSVGAELAAPAVAEADFPINEAGLREGYDTPRRTK